jgi:hypothetical protein
MTGFHVALLVAGSVLVVASVVANRFIPGRETHAVRAGEGTGEGAGEMIPVEA